MSTKIFIHDLTKVFPRHRRYKTKGLSNDGLSALKHLLKNTLKSSQSDELPEPQDNAYFYALNRLNFEVNEGEVLGIIGRNGAGKTTLLKILARILNPSAGYVKIQGRVMSMLELGIGFAPDLTVHENIQIQGRLSGVPIKQINAAEDSILEFSRLTAFRDTPLVACPSGSFAQLGFAIMMNLNVDIILADEVLAVGDARFRDACEERVRSSIRTGESVLFVSHDMNAIRRICNRVMWIDRGKILQVGSPEEVVQAYTAELLAGNLLPPLTTEGLNSSCRLLDLSLLDANRIPVGALQITEQGYVSCLLRVLRRDVAVTVQIELWQYKHCVLATTTQRPIISYAIATFRVALKIPANWLNEMSYQVRCRILVKPLQQNIAESIVAEEHLDFSVMNTRPEESVWSEWNWGRGGIISPKLSWKMNEEKITEVIL